MIHLLTWWGVLQMAGLAGMPVTWLLLRRLPDRGFAFLKPLGLLSWGYVLWLGASLHVLPNSRVTMLVLWGGLVAAGAAICWRRRDVLRAHVRDHLRYMLVVEVLFVVALGAAAVLRSYVPEIDGTEKPMDLAMLNGVLRSDFFPPQDPWLAGHTISYYYGGYVLNAIPASLTGVAPWVAYNLALAGTAALAAVAVFGLCWNLGRSILPGSRGGPYALGSLGVVLLLLLGSGEGVLEVLAAYGWGSNGFWQWWDIENLKPRATREWYPDDYWFWWRATRTTPDTIVEFPFFSFLLGDLHPHVMALPFGLTAIGAALSRLVAPIAMRGRAAVAEFVGLSVFIGSLAWVNTWDLPTFGFLIVVATALRLSIDGELRGRRFAVHTAAMLGVAILAFVPFYLTFRSQASGILPDRTTGTRPAIAALLWAPLIVLLLAALWRRGSPRRSRPVEVVLAPLLLFGAWSTALFVWEGPAELRLLMGDRGSAWLTAAGYALFAGLGVASALAWRRTREPGAAGWTLAALAGATAALLLLGAELFYIRDVFDNRMNTVFKLSYQAWPLLVVAAVAGAAGLVQGLRSGPSLRRVASGIGVLVAALLVVGGVTYSVAATWNRTDAFSRARTLDGLAFLRRGSPGEYDLAVWLARLAPDARIVEANGPDYRDNGRAASRSGLQGVIGWVGHELQWRGSTAPYEGRFEDVEEIYSTTDTNRALELLRTYGVEYVIVGRLERDRYERAGLRKFERDFPTAFESGDVKVYGVPDE